MEGERVPVRLHDRALGELIPDARWQIRRASSAAAILERYPRVIKRVSRITRVSDQTIHCRFQARQALSVSEGFVKLSFHSLGERTPLTQRQRLRSERPHHGARRALRRWLVDDSIISDVAAPAAAHEA